MKFNWAPIARAARMGSTARICSVVMLIACLATIAQAQQKQAPEAERPPSPSTQISDENKKSEKPSSRKSKATASAKIAPANEVETSGGDLESRLSSIEKQLSDVLQGIEKMRAATTPTESASASTVQSGNPSEEKKDNRPSELSDDFLRAVQWRSIGPANMGGRIVDLAVNPKDPSNWWAATATGGLVRTTNNGVTLEHQFDRETTVSVGAMAVSPSHPEVLYVGTGENNPRNSVSYGNGVYKSEDAGQTWKHVGLDETYQIGKVVIHPTDPNIVYVGALGRLYGNNDQRGVFKTTDGGATWKKVFYIDDRTGIIDMQMHPTDPNTLIVAAWERLRDGFDSWPGNEVPIPDGYDGYDPIRKYGPGSGLYKTTNGGEAWHRLTKGLPTSQLGRIGFDYFQADPNILYAVVDCENIGKGQDPLLVLWGAVAADRENGVLVEQIYANSPAEKSGLRVGDQLASLGDTKLTSFNQVLDVLRDKKPGDKFSITVLRGGETHELECSLASRSGASNVWMGITGEDDGKFIKITSVVAEGPSEKAGLKEADKVFEVDGKPTENYAAMIGLVRTMSPGDSLKIKVDRAGEKVDLAIKLEARPGSTRTPQPANTAFVGIQGRNAPDGGAEITEITKDGPAEKAGLMSGDTIKKLDGTVVDDYRELLNMLQAGKPGDKKTFTIARATETKEIEVLMEKRPGPTRPYSASLGGQQENVQDMQGGDGHEYGGIYKSIDGGESWTRVNSLHSRPMYFSVVRVDPNDSQFVYLLGVSQYKSENGGLTFDSSFGSGVHADGHALWVDPRDGRHLIIGVDGGIYVTYDRGKSWDHLNLLALGQFYHVAIGKTYPYTVYGGLQDNGTWGGPSQTLTSTGPINEDWLSIGGGDGFRCAVDPNDPDVVYYESQNGSMGRRNLKTGERASIRPQRVDGAPPYRFNWNTPFQLSNFNSNVFYAAGNHVFRSEERGQNLKAISPDITLTKRGSATAFAESPRNADVLYVGTDDGALWVTRDGGDHWTEIGTNLDLPAPRWVATVEASRFSDGRVYVCLDGHRSNDDEPYVFVSEDYGSTWNSIRNNLPWGSTRALREDLQNENLLLIGTEFKVYASTNRGGHWNCLNTNLPTVPVFDFAFHPENGDVVAATHGRSLWVTDITPLRQLTAEAVGVRPLLMQPNVVVRWRREATRGGTNQRFVGENAPSGAVIHYALPKKADKVSLRIENIKGEVVRELSGANTPGLHSARWDLIIAPPAQPSAASRSATSGASARRRTERPSGGSDPSTAATSQESANEASSPEESAEGQAETQQAQRAAQRSPAGRGGNRRPASPGNYRITLVVDGAEFVQELRIVNDPQLPISSPFGEEVESYWDSDDAESEEEDAAQGNGEDGTRGAVG
ncbi:MAG: PDZ domain-containing protein [Pirellulaceae bacterium]